MQKIVSAEKRNEFETKLQQLLDQGWHVVPGALTVSSLTTFELVEKPQHERRAATFATPYGIVEAPRSNYPEWSHKLISSNYFMCIVERAPDDERKAKQEQLDRFLDAHVSMSTGLTSQDSGMLLNGEITTRRHLLAKGLTAAAKLLKTRAAQRRLKNAFEWIARQRDQLRVGL